MRQEKQAIVLENDNYFEVRCASCGKLLFIFEKIDEKEVAERNQSVIIVSRCTRSKCNTDNIVRL